MDKTTACPWCKAPLDFRNRERVTAGNASCDVCADCAQYYDNNPPRPNPRPMGWLEMAYHGRPERSPLLFGRDRS